MSRRSSTPNRLLGFDLRFCLSTYQLAVISGTLATLVLLLQGEPHRPSIGLILPWAVVVAIVVLLPVPFWRSVELGMDFPILIAAGFLFPPATAGLIAFLGSFDPRELRKEVSIGQALFNRSQVAISVLLSS